MNHKVVGISGDKPEILDLFALEHQLNFTLLADESDDIATEGSNKVEEFRSSLQ